MTLKSNLKIQRESESASLSTLETYNAIDKEGSPISPLTNAAHRWSVHCKYALMQKWRRIFNYLHFRETGAEDDLLFRYP